MIENIKAFGKFLDQPQLINNINKKMPKILCTLGAAYYVKNSYDTFQCYDAKMQEGGKDRIRKNLIKDFVVLSAAIAGALAAPVIAGKLTKRPPLENISFDKKQISDLIDKFLQNNKCNEKCKTILNKAKDKILSYKEVKILMKEFNSKPQRELFEKIIPSPKNITAKDIFQEIGYLSIYGAVPVLSGLSGGIAVDAVQNENLKKTVPDKISEGVYQYLANIFMCNVGAGAALAILEKYNITSRSARAIGMTAGIVLTGIIGGTKAANFITKNIISPLVYNKKENIKERKVEAIDIGLHSDDIATVSLLSGLKWIEPALPVLYSVSGYRAGIGYRN